MIRRWRRSIASHGPSSRWEALPPASFCWRCSTFTSLEKNFSRPFHFGGHRGQDRVHVTAGLQAENGAAVVQQVELDITAAPDQLLLAVGIRPWRCEIA